MDWRKPLDIAGWERIKDTGLVYGKTLLWGRHEKHSRPGRRSDVSR
jgi:hypothetical protein